MRTYTEEEIQLIKDSLENMKQDMSKIKLEDLDQDDVNELFFLINTLREEYHNEIGTKFKSFKTPLLEKYFNAGNQT